MKIIFQQLITNKITFLNTSLSRIIMADHRNSKTILQELCQLHKYSMPIYSTRFINGQPHCPLFNCILKVNSREFRGRGKNKKEAEKNAAEKALKSLSSKYHTVNDKIVNDIIVKVKVDIYFDIENVLDVFKQFVTDYTFEHKYNLNVTGFISYHHHMKDKILDMVENKNYITIQTTRAVMKDAVDYHIALAIGGAIANNENRKIILVTKDKFGQILKTVITEDPKMSNIQFIFVSNIKDLMAELI